jgi:hypothetical protein
MNKIYTNILVSPTYPIVHYLTNIISVKVTLKTGGHIETYWSNIRTNFTMPRKMEIRKTEEENGEGTLKARYGGPHM